MKKLKIYNFKLYLILSIYSLVLIASTIIYFNYPNSNFYIGETIADSWNSKVSSCWQNVENKKKLGCHHSVSNKEKIILIGDSHASQLWIGLNEVFKDKYDIVILTSELLDDNYESWFKENQQVFIENYLGKNNVKYIIFAMAQHHLLQNKIRTLSRSSEKKIKIVNFINSISSISSKMNIKFIISDDTPRLSLDLPITTCINQYKKFKKSDCDLTKKDSLKTRENLSNLIKIFKKNGFITYDPFDVLCPTDNCSLILDGKPLYIDQNHVSSYGSYLIANDMKKIIE
jgi:hypothetical protein